MTCHAHAQGRPQPLNRAALISSASLEITGKDAPELLETAERFRTGTRISVAYLPNETLVARVGAASAIRRAGMTPVPHIAARRFGSQADLERYLDALAREAKVQDVFVVAGDLDRPEGPYADALSVIESGLLETYGVRCVGISGYPEGHPGIREPELRSAMSAKLEALSQRGLASFITTQFGFDAEAALNWLETLRGEGVNAPVALGLPGPANVKTLLRYAARCGVGASTRVMAKYGLSLTRLMEPAKPDALLDEFAWNLDPARHGEARLHFYPFGGLSRTADWMRDQLDPVR